MKGRSQTAGTPRAADGETEVHDLSLVPSFPSGPPHWLSTTGSRTAREPTHWRADLPECRAVGLEEVTCTGSQGGLPEEVCKLRPLTRRRPAGEEGRKGRGGPRVQPEHSVSSARDGGWMSLQLEAGFLHVRS